MLQFCEFLRSYKEYYNAVVANYVQPDRCLLAYHSTYSGCIMDLPFFILLLFHFFLLIALKVLIYGSLMVS